MASKKQIIQIGLLIVSALLVLIQFVRPSRNESTDGTNDISKKLVVPAEVQAILQHSCYDCHSDHTIYPWYTDIQPVGWWLHHHVSEGRGKLNFSEYATYSPRQQYHKIEEISKQVEEGEMPLSSYTLIHRTASLSAVQIKVVHDWCLSTLQMLKSNYPADSLSSPQRKKT